MEKSLNKKNTSRKVQRVGTGYSISDTMGASKVEDSIELATPVDKVTIMTTGSLLVTVEGSISGTTFAVGNATTTPSTVVMTHLASGFKLTRTAGEGKIVILAK